MAESTPVTLVASLVNGSASLSEDAGRVDVQLSLVPKPSAGLYTGCRVRLAAGSEATSADVTFQNQKKLRLENDWSAQAGLMSVVDDALVEGDETLVVEGHCMSSRNGADPSHADLVLQPLTLTIRDNDAAKPMALSVSPESIGESLGGQAVTVTARLEAPASAPADVALSLGRGAYSVAGARTISIQAGESHGSTELVVTPKDDGNATDDAVAVKGSASGYTVTETRLTIREPVVVEGVDVSGLGVRLSVSPTAIREGTRGAHRVGAVLTGVPVPAVDVAMVLAVGGTATEGASHDYVFKGDDDWRKLTVAANDAHLSAGTSVTVSALADGVEDGDETVTLSIGQVAWGATVVKLPEPATALLTITEAWDVPQAPSGLTVVPAPGDERHGLDVAWEAVSAVPSVDGYVVRHRAVSDPPGAWADSQPQPGLGHALTALAAGTRYEVRVRADSAAGRGAESGSVYARTADGDCTVGAPRVVTPTGTRSATELEVSWEAATCAASTTLAHYRVRHREDPDAEGVDNPWVEETSSTLTATLVGLTPDTAYVVEVRAVATGGDNGPWSAAGRGRTGLDARLPPRVAAPVVVAHADHGDERLDASWTRVEWTDGNGVAQPITEYQYRHRPAGGDWTTPTDARATAAEATAMTRTIAGLAFGTWHEVQVRGVNRMLGVAYPGKWSEPGRGRTWGVPDRVEEPAAYGTGSTVEVVWDAPDDGGSPINDYDVEYKGNSGGWTTHPYTGCAMDGCATETSIKTAAKKVRVRAGNAVGMGRWSPTAKVRTLKPLRVSFSVSSVTVPEGRSAQVGLRLHSTADRAVSVPLTKAGAVSAIRLDRAPGSAVAFGLGERERTFDVVALSDVDAGDEEVTLGLGPLPDGVLAGSPSSLAVTVEDDDSVNGAPTFGEGMAATRTVAEDAAEGTAVGLPVAATDPENDPLTYSLTAGSAPFVIDAATGQLRVGTDAQFDFEGGPSSYALTIEVSDDKDGAGQPDMASDASIAVTVEVIDVLEPPSAPAAPTLGLGFRSLPVVWAAPPNSGPPVNGYVISYRSAGAPLWAGVPIDGTDTETEIQSLRPGAAYEVRVRAVNDEGAGPWSGLAEANTWPSAVIAASTEQPVIGVGNAAAPVTLTATVEAAEGQLEGRWRRSGRDRVTQPLSESLALASGQAETLSVSSSAPGEWLHSIEVVHRLDGREATLHQGVEVEWLPSVVLDVEPDAVSEDGGPQEVAVTATLTGTAVTGKAKRVAVAVAGGTAAAGDDFAPVTGFEIAIPGGARSAQGTFTLTPVADGSSDHGETVSVSGTAVQTGTALPVTGAAVVINEAVATLRVEPPLNGRVAGVGEGGATVIDCGSDCSETLAIGAVLTLTATADDGHGFTGWTGDCSGTSPCTVTMDADRTVGAEFAALPGRPDAPSLSPTGHDALQVTWSAPSVTGTGIEEYGLRHRVPGGGTWTEATFGKATSAVIRSLASGTRYEVQVRAVAKEGLGPWSASGEAVTLPSVAVRVDDALPVIGADGAAASVTLTAAATAAEGDLTGRWVQRLNGKLVTVNGEPFTMASGAERSAAFRHDAPGLRAYGLMVAHGPNLGLGEVGETLEVRWLPSVVLSAAPAGVAEDGGPETVTVTARLTGSAVEDVAKRVAVEVGGGTATEGSDFAAVDDFEIALAAGVAAAKGTFTLAPVQDTDQEGSETVAVGGAATQNGIALPVEGATVAIEDAVRHSLTVSTPANGRITGPGIDCGGAQGTACTATYPDGTAVTLKAVADSGHLLRRWSGDCSGAGDCALTMNADRSVGAAFAAARTLTVAKPAKGKVTGTAGADQVIDCGDDCSETVIDGTVVALLASAAEGHRFDAWGGACASQATANCSVTLDADKSVSVAFAVGPVAGRCDENVVDGCAAGTLNEAAFEDKASHHFWRCDGINGGPDSPKCSKAKAGCAAGSLGWSVGGLGCSGTVAAAASGHLAPVTDGDDPTRGSASFKCDDSVWKEQSEASSCSVDLRCGASVNACLPSGVDLRDPTQTKAKAGVCAATEAARCLNGTLYRNRDDIPLRNGSCGTQVNQCASGTLQTLNGSSNAYRWRCLGVDAEDRWSCLGIDGSNQWTCAYGGWSKSCVLPIDATDDLTCGNGIVTQTASDADCFACKPGYESYNGVCVTPCGTNEKRDGSGNCVCKAGYHDSGGACVRDPYCPSPLTENQCGPAGASFMDLDDTVVHGKCEKTRAARCKAGTSDPDDDYDVAPQNGVCGESVNQCDTGVPKSKTQNSSSYLWDCEGYGGSKNWSCEGRDGYRKWQCEHGEKTANCQIPTGDPEIGKDASCGEVIEATTAKCISCKAGYALSDRSCVRISTLTVTVSPANKGTVSGTLSCTGTCTKQFGPQDGKAVSLTVAPADGYACSFQRNGQTSLSFTMTTADRAETVNCNCAAGHHLHNGNCVPDPFCPTPLTENQCGPDTANIADLDDTVVNGVCEATKAAGCSAGESIPGSDVSPQHGVCGTTANTCNLGTAENKRQNASSYLWDCEGTAGSRNWSCQGTDGHLIWECAHGTKTKECKLQKKGTSQTCPPESVPATTVRGCVACKLGYERKGDSCKLALKADAGGTYTAQPMRLTLPFGGWVNIFSAAVSASATGGVPPYKFQWSGPSVGDAAGVTYFFPGNQVFPVFRTVTVTDSASPAATDMATATINAPATSALAGASEEGFEFEVPLGGELVFIWGGKGDVTARSDNAEVVRVNTSSPAVWVAGVGLGQTHVVVKTADEEIWLPVIVR